MSSYRVVCPWCRLRIMVHFDIYAVAHDEPACPQFLEAGDARETLTAIKRAYLFPQLSRWGES